MIGFSYIKFKVLKHLVTGGAGFIGSNLIQKLLDDNQEVICLDNYFTGNKFNLQKWSGQPRFHFIKHDIIEPFSIEVERIWHLACPASPKHYQFDPIKTLKTSFLGTCNMLGLAKKFNARLLMASTSEVYGNPTIHPQPETYTGSVNTTGIRSCYDEGKRIAETLCADYKRTHNVNVRDANDSNQIKLENENKDTEETTSK